MCSKGFESYPREFQGGSICFKAFQGCSKAFQECYREFNGRFRASHAVSGAYQEFKSFPGVLKEFQGGVMGI